MNIDTNLNSNSIIFLADTQADISLIKIGSVQHNLNINSENTIQLKGITDGYIQSSGTQIIELYFDNIQINFPFHIVGEEFPIPSNGIIGKDFIQFFKCNLDYAE